MSGPPEGAMVRLEDFFDIRPNEAPPSPSPPRALPNLAPGDGGRCQRPALKPLCAQAPVPWAEELLAGGVDVEAPPSPDEPPPILSLLPTTSILRVFCTFPIPQFSAHSQFPSFLTPHFSTHCLTGDARVPAELPGRARERRARAAPHARPRPALPRPRRPSRRGVPLLLPLSLGHLATSPRCHVTTLLPLPQPSCRT